MKSLSIILFFLLGFNAFSADSGINPTSLYVKVTKVLISESVYCTDPITVFEDANALYRNIFLGPNFGDGSVPNATYNCVILEISDIIKPTPGSNSSSGNCLNGVQYSQDICTSGSYELVDGTTGTCSGSEQTVVIYVSTASSGTGSSFVPPTVSDLTNGLVLANAFVVDGSSNGTFTVNAANLITDNGSSCDLGQPTMSFAQ